MKEDRKKEERDFAILYQINQHNNDLNKDLDGIETLDNFVNADNIRRAILFDFFQIGELLSQLSEPFLKEFNNKHASDLISMRNRIVHGYGSLRDDIIFYTLKNDFPQFIDELMNIDGEKIISTNMKWDKVYDLLEIVVTCELKDQTGYPTYNSGSNTGYYPSAVIPQGVAYNVAILHENFFPKKNYTPSSNVYAIDEYIKNYTGVYEP